MIFIHQKQQLSCKNDEDTHKMVHVIFLIQNILEQVLVTSGILKWKITSRYLLVQSQEWKHQKNVWNLFKDNNKKDTINHVTEGVLSFLLTFEQISLIVPVLLLMTSDK